jgi:hypothetical protein
MLAKYHLEILVVFVAVILSGFINWLYRNSDNEDAKQHALLAEDEANRPYRDEQLRRSERD